MSYRLEEFSNSDIRLKMESKNPKTAKDKARKKSYYARHNAQDPNPDKFSARYWSHKVKW